MDRETSDFITEEIESFKAGIDCLYDSAQKFTLQEQIKETDKSLKAIREV